VVTRWRPTRAEIDLGAIRHNVAELGSFCGPQTERLAVVKANAYGHGDVEVARACLEAGATWLGVALVEEGVKLREAGFDVPILLLVEATPEASKEIIACDLTPSVSSPAAAQALSEASTAAGTTLGVHVCVDTGMHREGIPQEHAVDLTRQVADLPGLEVTGLWSHFARGEEDKHPFTATQIERFAELCERVAKAGIEVPMRHLTSSAGIVYYSQSHVDMVRMGIMTYGLYPHDALRAKCNLRAAMRLISAVGLVRRVKAGEGISYGHTYAPQEDTTIATVPIGYGDGYPRLLSNRTIALVGGKRRRIAGRVTMDTIMIEVGDDDVSPGDEVVLIGRQGAEEILADEIAEACGTINYEVVCSVGPRVPREFVG
jgi:alanine racemase